MKISANLTIFSSPVDVFSISSGNIELNYLPNKGDFVSFTDPREGVPLINLPEFDGSLKVDYLSFEISAGETARICIGFQEIVMDSEKNAEILAEYLEKGFNLFKY